MPPEILAKVRQKAFAAPAQIALIAAPKVGSKVPEWEQVTSASCTGFAIALAAHALGLGAIWKTSPVTDGVELRRVLGMNEADSFLGWVNVGTLAPDAQLSASVDRDVPDLSALVSVLDEHAGRTAYQPPR